MTADAGWLALALPVLLFTLPLLAGAWVLEWLEPRLRGDDGCGCDDDTCRGLRG